MAMSLRTSGSLVALLLWAAPCAAIAGDFTVDTPTAVTYTLNSNDTLTVTVDGVIATLTDGETAVDATGAVDASLINNGLISTSGDSAVAILGSGSDRMSITNNGTIITGGTVSSLGISLDTSPDSQIVNNGSISTSADLAHAVSVTSSSGTSVVNNGSITTGYDDTSGIFGADSANMSVTNNGTITVATGDASNGIYLLQSVNSRIVNTGTITALNNSVGVHIQESDGTSFSNYGTIEVVGTSYPWAVWIGSSAATVVNYGLITASGDDSAGIGNADSIGASISNLGTIRAKGVDAAGVNDYDTTGSVITNRGSIISEQSNAIWLDNSAAAVLNLSTAGYIGGGLQSDDPVLNDPVTVNLTTAASHSVLWDLSGLGVDPTSISGDVPWFYNSTTKQFATYDPSVFAGAFDELGDRTNLLSTVGQDGLGKVGIWASGVGGKREHAGDGVLTLDRETGDYGLAIGYSGEAADAATRWAIMGGQLISAMGASSVWASSYDIAGNTWFAGAQIDREFGVAHLDSGITGGAIARQGTRFVNDNLALTNGLTLGQGSAQESYGGLFVAPELGISADFAPADGWTLTPAAHLRYAAQWTGGFTETGSSANATVDGLFLGMLEADAELGISKALGFGTASARIGYQVRHATGDDAATVTMLDETNSVGFADRDTATGYAGFGLNVEPASNLRLTLNGTGYFTSSLTGGQASAALTVAF
jgi:hypothetical protein